MYTHSEGNTNLAGCAFGGSTAYTQLIIVLVFKGDTQCHLEGYVCAVTHRATPYQLALCIKKSLDDAIGTKQSACVATLQCQY